MKSVSILKDAEQLSHRPQELKMSHTVYRSVCLFSITVEIIQILKRKGGEIIEVVLHEYPRDPNNVFVNIVFGTI